MGKQAEPLAPVVEPSAPNTCDVNARRIPSLESRRIFDDDNAFPVGECLVSERKVNAFAAYFTFNASPEMLHTSMNSKSSASPVPVVGSRAC